MRRAAFWGLLASAALIATAEADAHPVFGQQPCASEFTSGGMAGCLGATTYATKPAFFDPQLGQHVLTSGQLPANPTLSQIRAWKVLQHTSKVQFPLIDYRIGPNDPATLEPISQWNADHPSDICKFWKVGDTSGPLPNGTSFFPIGGGYLYCRDTTANHGAYTETIYGYDFSNIGQGTGTDYVPIYLGPNGTNTNITLVIAGNNWDVVGPALSYSSNGYVIYDPNSASGTPFVDVQLYSNHVNGHHLIAPSRAGVFTFFGDNRGGANPPYQWPLEMQWNYLEDMGHDPVTGSQGGNETVKFNAVRNICAAGYISASLPALCHGELSEATGPNANVPVNYDDEENLYIVESSPVYIQTTAPFYGSGSENGKYLHNWTIKNNLIITNLTLCLNAPDYTSGKFGYGPGNVCQQTKSNGAAGSGLFNLNYLSHVDNLIVSGNVIDDSGAYYAFTNQYNSIGYTASITGGNTLNVTAPTGFAGGGLSQSVQLWPGQMLHDPASADNFIDTEILTGGTANNMATFTGSITAGVLTTTTAQNLIQGTVVNGSLGTFGGFPVGCYGVVGSGSGTTWTLVADPLLCKTPTTSAPANTAFISVNATSTCIPGGNGTSGGNGACGTRPLAATGEPNVTETSWQTYAGVDTVTDTGDNYCISSGVAKALNISQVKSEGQFGCPN